MSPVAASEVVSVGPQDVDAAGELVKRAGVVNHASQIQKMHALAYPRDVRTAQARPEDVQRTLYLDADEVEDAAKDAFDNVDEILGARVHGADGSADRMEVVVLYSVKPSGRSTRAKLPYAELEKSIEAYDEAEERGEIRPEHEQETVEQLRETVQQLREQVASERRARKAEDQGDPGSEAAQAEAQKTLDGNVDQVSKRVAKVETEAELDAVAQAEAEGKDRKGVREAIKARRADLAAG